MMSKEKFLQPELFYTGFNIENRVRSNHPLRQIEKQLDLSFVYKEVEDSYGFNGNASVPPPVILKLMLLLVFYNVRSERELMETLPERLDWLWYLGYDIDEKVPNHSVLSKARKRWGVNIFRKLFERVVWQCVEQGLVDGRKVFVDSSLIEANASNNSVVDQHSLKRYLNESYRKLEERLEEAGNNENEDKDAGENGKKGEVNERYISTTDPDASLVRQGGQQSKLQYKSHRVIDGAYRVITSTEITTGSVNEGQRLESGIGEHERNTENKVEVVVADSKYGTKENYLNCFDRGIDAHIPDLKESQDKGNRRADIYSMEAFKYDEETGTYVCPGGNRLRPRSKHKGRGSIDYGISGKICNGCFLKDKCTKAKSGRTIHREVRQKDLDEMRAKAISFSSKRDIKIRQHLMEGSFGQAVRYGFKRSRWRRKWRVKIQDYLIATIQNLMILIKQGNKRKAASVIALQKTQRGMCIFIKWLELYFSTKYNLNQA